MKLTLDQQPNDLNPSQWHAVCHTGKFVMIVAGPGTGKTHTLTYKMAMMSQKLLANEKILGITFTRKAAQEMRERLKDPWQITADKFFIGTFHQFCLDILMAYGKLANLADGFRVVGEEEIIGILKEHFTGQTKRTIKNQLNIIQQKKSLFPFNEDGDVLGYNRILHDRGCLDYDDLLLETVRLLEERPQIVEEVNRLYPMIFVDEYQDVNAVQHHLLKQLVKGKVHLTVIGDPQQAIYGFRGADVSLFRQFSEDYPGAVELALSENYRCGEYILKASHQMITKIDEVPRLICKIHREGQLTIYQAQTPKAEAEYVVHQIERLVGGTSLFSQDSGRVTSQEEAYYSFGDMAILYRLKTFRSFLVEALERSGIPFQIAGEEAPAVDNGLEKGVEKVNLLTMHAAKGLEFPVVFIVGCEQHLMPLDLEHFETNMLEERRLFYVAMTRAKERLYFLSAKKRMVYGQWMTNAISPFVKDIDEQLKQYDLPSTKKKKPKKNEDQLTLF
ncbi:MAG: ATP-dependent helicase [Candidatus Omnitrophica bacterium]|nr:ATP-dependent helicase [Candidatus Omnitrophota bacterium]